MTRAAAPILLVDDSADQREAVREVLESAGYDVVEAPSGRDALAYLTSQDVDEPTLIFLDITMPGMSGWELLAILKSYTRLARIPVVIISGDALTHPEAKTQGLIKRYLQKPVSVEEILAAAKEFAAVRLSLVKPG